MTTITERVAAGAKFLDEHDPDWWRADVERAINLDHLALADPGACVLGQRCPVERIGQYLFARWGERPDEIWNPENFGFWALAYQYSGTPDDTTGDREDDVAAWSNALGFNSKESDPDEYDDLTAEWRKVITERRAS